MAEYKSREDIETTLNEYFFAVEADEIMDIIDEIPSADVRENVKGYWIDDGFLGRLTCSNCGAWIGNFTGTVKLNGCPNCLADMRDTKK